MVSLPKRKNIRLPGYDYRENRAYYVTICSFNRMARFGVLADSQMQYSEDGQIALREWEILPERFSSVALDAFVLMPNHLHGIITFHEALITQSHTLGQVIGAYKSRVTSRINAHLQTNDEKVWQRNYYERVIRDENEMNRIRLYIAENPVNWSSDEHYPA